MMYREIDIFTRSVKDYFTAPMLKMLLYPFLGSLLIMYILFFGLASSGLDYIDNAHLHIEQQQTQIENGNINTQYIDQTYTGSGVVDFLLKYTATSWLAGFILYAGGFFIASYLSIFLSLLIIGLLTPRILALLKQRHNYKTEISGYGNISNTILGIVKRTIVMILLFIAMFPLYFIPVVNIFAINFPLFYFFHKTLHYDVSSELMSKNRFGQIYYSYKSTFRFESLLLYIASLIPFVPFFISVFYIIYIGNSYFLKLQEGDI